MNSSSNGKPTSLGFGSLTEVEVVTRNTLKFPFADGHAAQYDEPWWQETEAMMSEFEYHARNIRDKDAEQLFRQRFFELFNQPAALDCNYKIEPNASRSIDVFMTLCAGRKWSVQLIAPAFDNLALYARKRGVRLGKLDETRLREYGDDAVDSRSYDAVFIVVPNNPGGFTLSREQLQRIAEKCARDRKTIVIDASFRAYDPTGVDHYQLFKDAGCSWCIIEDTGKVFPTSERKASIISCSNDLKQEINEIVEIDVLGWSRPVLLMLAHLVRHFQEIGLPRALHHRVRAARELVRESMTGTFLRPAREAVNSSLPMEWIEILDDRVNDEAIATLTMPGSAVMSRNPVRFDCPCHSREVLSPFGLRFDSNPLPVCRYRCEPRCRRSGSIEVGSPTAMSSHHA